MKIGTTLLAATVAAAALTLAACDRSDQKPVNTAQSAPQSGDAQPAPPSNATAEAAKQPDQSASAPQPDGKTKQQPPVQGQIDSREGPQKRNIDGKG